MNEGNSKKKRWFRQIWEKVIDKITDEDFLEEYVGPAIVVLLIIGFFTFIISSIKGCCDDEARQARVEHVIALLPSKTEEGKMLDYNTYITSDGNFEVAVWGVDKLNHHGQLKIDLSDRNVSLQFYDTVTVPKLILRDGWFTSVWEEDSTVSVFKEQRKYINRGSQYYNFDKMIIYIRKEDLSNYMFIINTK